jgi:microcystin-dependent protein
MSFIPKTELSQTALHILPTGTVIAFSGIYCPIGWKFCNGEELIVNDYFELFNVIGHRYGGSGTRFKLPNLNGRVIVGQDKDKEILTGDYNNILASFGGEITHLLTEAEMPSHRHHSFYVNWVKGAGSDPDYYSGLNETNSHGFNTTSATGGSTSHNNMQPYLILNYIIKTDSSNWQETNIVTYTPINYSSPIGTILPYSSSIIPNGWLLCDGTSYIKSNYPELSTLLEDIWGGDPTNFNVPDLRGRTLVGIDGGAGRITTNNLLANVGGEEKHTLTINELAKHSHFMFSDEGSGNDGGNSNLTQQSSVAKQCNTSYNEKYAMAAGTVSATLGVTSDVGGDQNHNNLQPYAVVNFIIKALNDSETNNYIFLSNSGTITSASTYFIDATSGHRNITLSSSYPDKTKITLRKIDSSINTVTIVDQGILTIELATTYILSGSQPVTMMKTTNGWFITQL